MELVTAAELAELRRDWLAPRRFCRVAADDVRVLEGAAGAGAGADDGDGLLVELEEVVRPITGGVETRGVPGFEDFGVLDQDVKKSSSGSSFTTAAGSIPSTAILSGKLRHFHRSRTN